MKKLHNIIFVLAIAFVFISCVDEDAETCNELELRFLEEPPNYGECNFVRNNCSAFPQISDFCMTANHLPNPDENGDDDNEDPTPTTCTGDEIRNVSCGLNSRGFQKQICVEGIFINHPLEPCGDPDVCVDGTEEDDSCEFGGETGIKTRTCEDGQWSEFTECHVCNEGEIDSVSYSGNLINAFRVCHSANGYGEYMFDDYNNAVNSKLYYKESGDFFGETFTTTTHVEEFSVSFWMRFDEGTNTPSGIFELGSGGIRVKHLNLRTGNIGCSYTTEYCMPDHNFLFGLGPTERVQTPNVDNHIVVIMSQDYFRYYLNGEEITTITKNGVLQDPENGFDGFDSSGLPAGTKFELGHGMNDLGVVHYLSHTTIIDGILSPEDVALLYAKGPASP